MSRYKTPVQKRLGPEAPKPRKPMRYETIGTYIARVALISTLAAGVGGAIAKYAPQAIDWVKEHRVVELGETRSVYQAADTP